MARVLVLIPDLLFGSRVLADLSRAGHDVQLINAVNDLPDLQDGIDVLVVDLTDDGLELPDLAASKRPRTLAFYSHVDVSARRSAEEAGFDLIVPRSRMAREGAALISQLVRS